MRICQPGAGLPGSIPCAGVFCSGVFCTGVIAWLLSAGLKASSFLSHEVKPNTEVSASAASASVEKFVFIIVNDKPVKLTGKKDYIFVDVFEFIDFDLSKPQGRAVVTNLNGEHAQYNQFLNEGDKLDIYWEK